MFERGRRGMDALANDSSLEMPKLYWRELGQLKAAAIYMRLYRNRLARYVRAVEIVKAVASSSAIAGWAIFQMVPFLWASIIVAAQLLDAVKDIFPFARQHKSASTLTIALETLFIEAEAEWQNIHQGKIPAEAITERRMLLQKHRLELEQRSFQDGFESNPHLADLATTEAEGYFKLTYEVA
jgi:hypothetical protein